MPLQQDKITLNDPFLKRSVKLLPCQKESIVRIRGQGISINQIARMFGVNKRTIQFILFPERLEQNKALRNERGGSKIYYDTQRNTESQRSLRKYKKELFLNNKQENKDV